MFPRVQPFAFGLQGPKFVAGGVQAGGASIPVSTSGAGLGDLIIALSSFGSASAPGGTGWTSWDDAWGGSNYNARLFWKLLSSTADITYSGDGYSHLWAVFRNARQVRRNAFAVGSAAVTFGALGGATTALAMIAMQQATAGTLAALSSPGFTSRVHGDGGSIQTIDLLSTAPDPGPVGSHTVSGWTPGGLLALELGA